MGQRSGGRFVGSGDVPPCPFVGHRGSRVRSFGSRQRKDGTWVRRFSCVTDGLTHTFSECYDADPLPVFASAKCPQNHRGKVTRKGTNHAGRAKHQRYLCVPSDGNASHTFTLTLPRQKVDV